MIDIEVLTPKQSAENIEEELAKFAEKFNQVIEAGYSVSMPDNPMGEPRFKALEVILELDLPCKPEQMLLHVNTFHTREDLDNILKEAIALNARRMLVISGDGGERLAKLSPASIGMNGNAVTSVELLQYIHREYPGEFDTGVAFNPYEPQEHELEKMKRKIEAGARYIITQPIVGRDDRLDALRAFGVPVTLGAWMSKKLHLFAECVGYPIDETMVYDPLQNLRTLLTNYPGSDLYLSLLGFKTQLPELAKIVHHG